MLKTSPFHARTAPLVRAQTWRRWAGYQMASAYDPHPDREYAAIRNAAALLDVSPLHKYVIRGSDAERLLDRMITRDVTKLKLGQKFDRLSFHVVPLLAAIAPSGTLSSLRSA